MEGKRRRLFPSVVVALVMVFSLVVFWFYGEKEASPEPLSPIRDAQTGKAPPDPPPIETLPLAIEFSAMLNREEATAGEDLQTVAQLLYFYRQGFGENPVGQNEDIVSALLGENEKRSAFLPEDCSRIVAGKLMDRWGTPYWFHPVSGREMEIRSAGPDKELFTGDDLMIP